MNDLAFILFIIVSIIIIAKKKLFLLFLFICVSSMVFFRRNPDKAEAEDAPSSAIVDLYVNAPDPGPVDLLSDSYNIDDSPDFGKAIPSMDSQSLLSALQKIGIDATVIGRVQGPVITRFAVMPKGKVSVIKRNIEDISIALGQKVYVSIDDFNGKRCMVIDIPNKKRALIPLKSVLTSNEYKTFKGILPIAFGTKIDGTAMIDDLYNSHLLIAGPTGSGKSSVLNSILVSMICRFSPEELQFLFMDPKGTELSVYDGLPHVWKKIMGIPPEDELNDLFNMIINEVERRYAQMLALRDKKIHVNNIIKYNQLTGNKEPILVIVIEEFSDIMLATDNLIETAVTRIAQKARAAGIVLILVTQRPTKDVIGNVAIKANMTTRIALTTTSAMESRVILDESGAEKLHGKGDMLYKSPNVPLTRVNGAFIDTEDIRKLVEYFQQQYDN